MFNVPTKVLSTDTDLRTELALFITVVSRYSEMAMRYAMRPLTAPPSAKQRRYRADLKTIM